MGKKSWIDRLPVINRDWLIYGLSLLLDFCVGGVWFVAMRRLSDTEHAQGIAPATTAVHLGVLGGATFLTYALGALVSGRMSDRFGRRRMMVLGAITYAVAALFCSRTEVFLPLTLCFLLFGVGGSIFWPPTIAWLGENKSGATLRWALGCFCLAWNLGILLGSALGGVLYVWSPPGAIIGFAAAMAVGALLVLWPSRPGTSSVFAGRMIKEDAVVSAVRVRSHHFVRAAWLANFAAVFALAGTTSLFPQLATSLGVEPPIHGQLVAAIRFTAMIAFVLVQFTVLWRYRTWPLLASQLLGLVSVIIIAVGHTTMHFALAFLLMGMGSGFNYYASVYYSLEAYPQTKGRGTGFHEAVLGAGLLLGPISSGVFGWWVSTRWPEWGLRAPYWFCAALFFFGGVGQMIWFLSGRTAAKPLPESAGE